MYYAPFLVCIQINLKSDFNNSYNNDDNTFIIIVLIEVMTRDKIGLSFAKSIIL